MGACKSKTAPATDDDAAKAFADTLRDEDGLRVVFEDRARRHQVERAAMVYITTDRSNSAVQKPAKTTTAFVGDKVDENSLFQAASLSKAVSAAAILSLAEQSEISIDEDIHPYVTSLDWTEIEGGDTPVTLRELLSHTAGATVHGFGGYPLTRRAVLPSSVEIVLGVKHITNSPPVKLTGKKGVFDYSGGGYMIAQVFAEDVSGLPFDVLLQEFILGPLGMTKSCFTQPLDPHKTGSLHITPAKPNWWSRLIGRPGTWHNFPELAAAGLWTTPRDYARFVTALMDAAIHDTHHSPLSRHVAREMVTPVANNYGLGVGVAQGANGDLFCTRHDGVNDPGYRTEFEGFRNSCVVVMTNSPSGLSLSGEVLDGARLLANKRRGTNSIAKSRTLVSGSRR